MNYTMLIFLQNKVSCLDVILTLGSFRGTECLTFGSHAWTQVLNAKTSVIIYMQKVN